MIRTSNSSYDGRLLNEAVAPDTHISLPAVETPSGFTAENGVYQYEITGAEVVIMKNSAVLSTMALTRVAP